MLPLTLIIKKLQIHLCLALWKYVGCHTEAKHISIKFIGVSDGETFIKLHRDVTDGIMNMLLE